MTFFSYLACSITYLTVVLMCRNTLKCEAMQHSEIEYQRKCESERNVQNVTLAKKRCET